MNRNESLGTMTAEEMERYFLHARRPSSISKREQKFVRSGMIAGAYFSATIETEMSIYPMIQR